jgi:hypothetical protein
MYGNGILFKTGYRASYQVGPTRLILNYFQVTINSALQAW